MEPMHVYAVRTVDHHLQILQDAAGDAATQPGVSAIHHLRVSVRRFSQTLTVFEQFLPAAAVKKIRRRLKKLMRLSSSVRNCDIALEFLEETRGTSPALKPVRTRLTQERIERGAEFAALLQRWHTRAFAPRWRAALNLPPGGIRMQSTETRELWDPEAGAAENAHAVLPGLASQYFSAGRKAVREKASHRKLHRFRLKTKRFRYTLELFHEFYDASFDVRLCRIREIQTRLGKMSDHATMADLFEDDPALAQGARRRAAKHAEEFAAYWMGEFDKEGEEERWAGYLEQPVAVP
ncbi:MAG TPA: CHAD domain-containing protein [Bryobacteraceae bacterium]|nr:CHAD domain-containing protein [Bryobacteraceae bacterium]